MTDPEKLIWDYVLLQTDKAVSRAGVAYEKGGYEAFLSKELAVWACDLKPSEADKALHGLFRQGLIILAPSGFYEVSEAGWATKQEAVIPSMVERK